MKIKIENLGPYNNCEIEQKPLTIFIGPNGTGKTWTAYLIACIFGPHMWEKKVKEYLEEANPKKYTVIEDAINKMLNDGSAKIDLQSFVEEFGQEYLNDVCKMIPEYFADFLATKKVAFSNLKINLDIHTSDYSSNIKQIDHFKKLAENKEEEALLTVESPKEDSNLYIYTRSTNELKTEIPLKTIRRHVVSSVFMLIHKSVFSSVHYFPAERTGLTLLFSSSIVNASKASDQDSSDDLEKEDYNNSLSGPVGDLIGIVASSRTSFIQERQNEMAKVSEDVRSYIELSRFLEKMVLNGTVEIGYPTNERPELEFRFLNTDKTFDISPLSSSVKDLIPLVLYLRYFARKRQLIVIDEPEMNLHPEVQLKIMEFVGILINSGLNVIITTHSPYLVDHISNLTRAYKLKKEGKENLGDMFKLKNELSFLNPQDVSVYLFDNGTVTNVFTESGLVDWQTFSDVTDYVQELYYDLKVE
jgi:energy-coupling factor transporter ATP-binding protein EcfA2